MKLPTSDQFCKGQLLLNIGNKNHSCALGWYTRLYHNLENIDGIYGEVIYDLLENIPDDKFSIFSECFVKNAKQMNLNIEETHLISKCVEFPDSSKNIIAEYNDHPDNTKEQIAECFGMTMKEMGYNEGPGI